MLCRDGIATAYLSPEVGELHMRFQRWRPHPHPPFRALLADLAPLERDLIAPKSPIKGEGKTAKLAPLSLLPLVGDLSALRNRSGGAILASKGA